MEKLLSIIIPVYNVAEYLQRCIISLGKIPERDDIEVLVIDDGSTDGSEVIADKLVKPDRNILVFHKENGGLSDARNYGLIRATGKYVMFIDSDDEINEENLAAVLEDLTVYECDSIVWRSKLIDETSVEITRSASAHVHPSVLKDGVLYTSKAFIMEQLKNDIDISTVVWIGVFKKECILKNWLFFENVLHEDELWTIRAFMFCNDILYRNLVLYKHRIRSDSILESKSNAKKKLKDAIYAFESQYNYFECHVDDKELKRMLNGMISRKYLANLGKSDYSNIKAFRSQISRKRIYNNSYRKEDKIRAMLMRFNIFLFYQTNKIAKTVLSRKRRG